MANVFISHRMVDRDRAESLARELHDAGHQVWLDDWEIAIGDSIVRRIEEGLEGSAYLVLCYSGEGATSAWMSREWMSTLARQLDGKNVKILPVRLSGGTPPAILADIRYADLVDDWTRGVTELLRAVR